TFFRSDDLVDEAVVERLRGRHRIAAQNHRQRLVDADQARKPLGAAGTGQDAELDLKQAEPGRGRGDAIVAGEGDLEAAAERRAEEGRDERALGHVLGVQNLVYSRTVWRP